MKIANVRTTDTAPDANAFPSDRPAEIELARAHSACRRALVCVHPDAKATALRAAEDHTARALYFIRQMKD